MSCNLQQQRTKPIRLDQSSLSLVLKYDYAEEECSDTTASNSPPPSHEGGDDTHRLHTQNNDLKINLDFQRGEEDDPDINVDEVEVINMLAIAQEKMTRQQKGIPVFPKTHAKTLATQYSSNQKIREGELIIDSTREIVECTLTLSGFEIISKRSKKSILCIRFDIFPCQTKIVKKGKMEWLEFTVFRKELNEMESNRSKEEAITFRLCDCSSDQSSFELTREWFKDVNWCIAANICRRIQATKQVEEQPINLIPCFWTKPHMSMSEFEGQADTLDLVFFVGSSITASMTRAFCRSEYDHIALVLRGRDDRIFFLEAGYTHGVTLYTWEKFKQHTWKDTYSSIVYRKFYGERSNEMMDVLDKFVKTAVGRPYEITLSKMFKKRSVISQPEAEEGRTFFCSELIAAIYKRMGLINQIVSSARYMPGDFAENRMKDLLVEGTYLGKETVIYM